jgi:hypothetical protein
MRFEPKGVFHKSPVGKIYNPISGKGLSKKTLVNRIVIKLVWNMLYNLVIHLIINNKKEIAIHGRRRMKIGRYGIFRGDDHMR